MRIYSDKSTAAWMESATNWHNMISLQFCPGFIIPSIYGYKRIQKPVPLKYGKLATNLWIYGYFYSIQSKAACMSLISSHLNQNWTGSVNCWRFSVSRSGLCSVRFRWGRRTLLNTKYEVLTRTYCRSVSSSSRMIFLMRGEFGRGRSVA